MSSLNRPSKPPEPAPQVPAQPAKAAPKLSAPPSRPTRADSDSPGDAQAGSAPLPAIPESSELGHELLAEDGAVTPTPERQHPIPPPSEPMQNRAIGLIRGRYTASPDQFTKGTLSTEDGTLIDAVLLGRIMSLVKKHLSLEQEHLWVVYPRTRENDPTLHVQIVGVWEPERLSKPQGNDGEEVAAPVEPEPWLASELEDGYFSVRGEIIFASSEDNQIVVKIRQAARKAEEQERAFKLQLHGTLTGKTQGHFWDLQAHRQGNQLVIAAGHLVGMVPPRKRPPDQKRSYDRKPDFREKRSYGLSDENRTDIGRGTSAPAPLPVRKTPVPKPIKKSQSSEELS